MSKLDEIQVKVQKYLSEALGNINVGSDGLMEFPFGSTKASIRVKELMGDIVVEVMSPVVFDPSRTEGLLDQLNLMNLIGPVTWIHINTDSANVVIAKYAVLGEFLDFEELRYAISLVCNAADSMDEDMAKDFMGKRFAD